MEHESEQMNEIVPEGKKLETEQVESDNETIDDTDSSGSDSQSDQDNENEAEMLDEKEYENKLKVLEQTITENPFSYQSYIDIIKLAKENVDFSKLKEYRQNMSNLFPLTENLWLDWLRDELKLMTTDENREKVTELFEKAISDYLSPGIWLEFIQFSIGEMGKPNGIEKIRSVCERGIHFAGLHVTKGYCLWEAYREFESAILSGLQASFAGSVQNEQQTQQLNEQIGRIVSIFKRQINVCLDNTEATFNELKEFDDSFIDEELTKARTKTLLEYQKLLPFEMALGSLSVDEVKKLAEYKSYLEFEIKNYKHKNPLAGVKNMKQNGKHKKDENEEANPEELEQHSLRIKCLFERAIANNSNCLDAALWLKYIYFLNEEEIFDNSNESTNFYLKVSERSVRNCPWSSKLWINYAFNLEKAAYLNNIDSTDIIKGVFNQALNSGLQTSEDYLQVWHSYLDFLKRMLTAGNENLDSFDDVKAEEIRDAFQKAIDQLFDFFKHKGDPTFSLEKYWAFIEAKYFKNMEKSRKIYNEMILAKTDAARYAQIWLEFFDLEKEFGNEKHQRRVLNRALNEVNMDEKEIIYEIFSKFEKHNGNVQHHANIYFRYEQFREVSLLIAARKKSKTQQQAASASALPKVDFQKPKQARSEQGKQPFEANKKPIDKTSTLKRKKSESEDTIENNQAKKQPSNLKDKDGFAIPSLPFQQPEAPKPISKFETAKKLPENTEPVKTTEQYKKFSDHTVFISNLSYEVDEVKLAAIFEKEPGFIEIRLVRNWSGKSKGYGYVDFDSPENAKLALKLDRSTIDTRPLYVSKNTDKSQEISGVESKLKYATNLEKNKLFISGLPFSMSNKELENILEKFGKVKEVRIVVYKNGKSKGLAYAEFEDQQSASNALLKTDQMLIGDNQISVAISNPPKRKKPDEESSGPNEKARSLGSGSYKTGVAPAPKTSTSSGFSFVPRSQVIGRKKTLSFK